MKRYVRPLRSVLRFLLRSEKADIPLETSLLLTERCDYRCRVCRTWKGIRADDERPTSSSKQVEALIEQCAELGVPTFALSGGEPLLHPDALEIIEHATRRIGFVRLTTTASRLTPGVARRLVKAGLGEIWVSLDGLERHFNRFRGTPDAYARTVAGIENVAREKRRSGSDKPRILVNTIVTEDNRAELPALLRMLAALGVQEVNLAAVCNVPEGPARETARRLGRDEVYSGQFTTPEGARASGTRLTRRDLREVRAAGRRLDLHIDSLLLASPRARRAVGRCTFPWTNLLLLPTGDAVVCPMMDRALIGNVHEQPIMSIWNSATMRVVRREMDRGIPICAYCVCSRRTLRDHLEHYQTLRRLF